MPIVGLGLQVGIQSVAIVASGHGFTAQLQARRGGQVFVKVGPTLQGLFGEGVEDPHHRAALEAQGFGQSVDRAAGGRCRRNPGMTSAFFDKGVLHVHHHQGGALGRHVAEGMQLATAGDHAGL